MGVSKKSDLDITKQESKLSNESKLTTTEDMKLRKECKMLRTFIIQFIFSNGNGWAFVNATSPSEAEVVFQKQSKFKGAVVTGIKETKWFGNTMQLVFEGSVCTTANVDVTVSLSDLIAQSDAFDSVEQYLNTIYNFDNYYTKAETQTAVNDAVAEALRHIDFPLNLDLTDYMKKEDLPQAIQDQFDALDIHSGEDGVTPHINTRNYHWMIGDTDTGVVAKGTNGTNGKNGTDGVGIESLRYERSLVSGGANKLFIKLTNSNTEFEYIILNGKDGNGGVAPSPQVDAVEVLSLYRGDEAAAKARAQSNQSTMFQFILDTQDSQGNPFTKVIWYIGDGKFIDALGSVIFTL